MVLYVDIGMQAKILLAIKLLKKQWLKLNYRVKIISLYLYFYRVIDYLGTLMVSSNQYRSFSSRNAYSKAIFTATQLFAVTLYK